MSGKRPRYRPNTQSHHKHGSWIKPMLRLAIYHRDGFRCMYCGIKDGEAHPDGSEAKLTLDHVTPPDRYRGKHYPHHPSNLLTACVKCNSAKRDMPMHEYVAVIGRPELKRVLRDRLRKSWEHHLAIVRFDHAVDKRAKELIEERIRNGELQVVDASGWEDGVPGYGDDPF